ncbi:uncharacterized protein MYCFIDRAFT_211745 [Pseudocercospora fijiensis CIRAD86]|uniref:Uncharacterized protein n=1 Tax=Pseudocercospora fijiensis (strain CIRAD86) TaxID=383855 RepID=M2ZPQ8_PSEFD|nr:uncharacterized protein MYCFIDRAFT_211745 [Pseudocercospora fijiensis CIRAD86]EME81069.1 hypothetical protein MYCFIDRAFT_211745 [Pseudocercospora fijiensis CIRAD86]
MPRKSQVRDPTSESRKKWVQISQAVHVQTMATTTYWKMQIELALSSRVLTRNFIVKICRGSSEGLPNQPESSCPRVVTPTAKPTWLQLVCITQRHTTTTFTQGLKEHHHQIQELQLRLQQTTRLASTPEPHQQNLATTTKNALPRPLQTTKSYGQTCLIGRGFRPPPCGGHSLRTRKSPSSHITTFRRRSYINRPTVFAKISDSDGSGFTIS